VSKSEILEHAKPGEGLDRTPIRVLVVAAPFVSRAGVYTSLRRTLPLVMDAGIGVGVLWSSRVPGGELPGDWVLRLDEPRFSVLRQLVLARQVRNATKAWKPHVLLSVLPQSDMACAKVASALNIPWIAMIRGRPFPTGREASALKKVVWQASVRHAYRSATMRIAVSADLAEEVRESIGVSVDEIVYNGVDLDGYPFQPRTSAQPRVGFVGRLTDAKAPIVLCDIARMLDRPVEIIGDGPLKGRLEEIAAGDARVHLRGWLPSAQAMQEVDILVVPSLREAFGNVILEAGASGAALVARHSGGVPEILERDELLRTCCLVPEHSDAADFAAAVRRLLDDGELRAEIARRLREMISRDFSVEAAAERLASLIRRVA
jgi:glycosyltransferase involved in cell wall biosynthesis